MKVTARELAEWLNGSVDGNPDVAIDHLSKIEEATVGSLSFIGNLKYQPFAYTTGASVLIVRHDFVAEKPLQATLIRVADAQVAFGILLEKYQALAALPPPIGIEQPSFVASTARVGEGAYIGAFVYVGNNAVIGKGTRIYPHSYIGDNVIVGDDSILYAGIKIYAQCIIGSRCVIHAGAVIGSDGFGFAPLPDGTYQKVPQTGNVIIEDDVEIGANTTIDRATLGATLIRRGAKLDNLIQIAHNVEIGEYTVIAAQSGIAGSTRLGARCVIGGQVGIVGHLKIADGTKIQAQSGIDRQITEANQAFMGTPAMPYRSFQRSFIIFKQLPELATKLRELEMRIADKNN